jgi:tetratricopeptide (TPR) repeat protein
MGKETLQKSKSRGRVIPFEQNGDYFYQKGIKAYHQRDLVKARRLFERAVYLSPLESSYISQLALTLAELQEFEEANVWLDKLVHEVDTTMVESHFFMANNYAHIGLFYEAKHELNRYLSLDPEGPFIEEAEELLDLIIEEFEEEDIEEIKEEEQIVVKHEHARKLIEQGDYQNALERLQQLIDEHPTFWPAYNNLSLAHYYLNEFNQAFEVLDNLLEKNPGNLHGLCNLALMYDYVGFENHREKLLSKLQNITPILPEHRFKMGTTFGVLGYHTKAYGWFLSIKKYGMKWGETYYHWLAVSAFLSNHLKIAESAWRRILEIDPDGEVAPYFIKKLEDGTLQPTEVDYHYRIEQPKLTSKRPKLENTVKNKLSHLYLLYRGTIEQTEDALEQFCLNPNESLILKEMAAHILLEYREEVTIAEQEDKLTFDEPILWAGKGFKILEMVQEKVAKGSIKVDHMLLERWYTFLQKARVSHSRYTQNKNAWAGAIAFLYFETKQEQKTRKELAGIFQISASTLGKYITELRKLL